MSENTINIEHEIKVLDANLAITIQQLKNLWAHHVHTVSIRDRYYDTNDDLLAQHGQNLRIRWQDGTMVITRKTKYENDYTKSMREDDTPVDDLEEGKKFLEKKLGLVCKRYKEKKRVTYQREDALFDFDYYEGLPPVLEIEGKDPEEVALLVRRLWLHFQPQVKWWSRKLFKHYGKKYTILGK